MSSEEVDSYFLEGSDEVKIIDALQLAKVQDVEE